MKGKRRRGKVPLRDKVAYILAGTAMRMASPWYRSIIRGSIKLGHTDAAIPEPQVDDA